MDGLVGEPLTDELLRIEMFPKPGNTSMRSMDEMMSGAYQSRSVEAGSFAGHGAGGNPGFGNFGYGAAFPDSSSFAQDGSAAFSASPGGGAGMRIGAGGLAGANPAAKGGRIGAAPGGMPNPYAPESLNFPNSDPSSGLDDPREPGTFTFRDLQDIKDVGSPTMKAGTHNAYEDALLQYSGLNEEEGDAFQYSSSPSNGGMRGGFGAGANPGANLPAAAAGPPGGFNHQNKMAFAPPNRGAPLKFAPPKFATAHDLPRRGGGHAESNSDDDSDDDVKMNPASSGSRAGERKTGGYKLTRDEAIQLLNKDGGVASEEELNEIDPSYLSADQVKKLKRMRRAIRNRESATASRMRRKEYIESLEKRTSELCSENALLDLSVTEMQMREKGKADELERIRQENEQLRKETYHNRAENHQLKRDKQVIEEKLKNVKLVDQDQEPEFAQPGTWPLPKNHPQRLVIQREMESMHTAHNSMPPPPQYQGAAAAGGGGYQGVTSARGGGGGGTGMDIDMSMPGMKIEPPPELEWSNSNKRRMD